MLFHNFVLFLIIESIPSKIYQQSLGVLCTHVPRSGRVEAETRLRARLPPSPPSLQSRSRRANRNSSKRVQTFILVGKVDTRDGRSLGDASRQICIGDIAETEE